MEEMKKMTKMEALFESILLELFEIKYHIANDNAFEGGVALGGLMNKILQKKDKASDKEVQDEEDEEGSEEDDFDQEDEDEEEYDYQSLYQHEYLENNELKQKLTDTRTENKEIKLELIETENLLMEFYNNDHIFPQERDKVRNFFLKSNKFDKSYIGKIFRKVIA